MTAGNDDWDELIECVEMAFYDQIDGGEPKFIGWYDKDVGVVTLQKEYMKVLIDLAKAGADVYRANNVEFPEIPTFLPKELRN